MYTTTAANMGLVVVIHTAYAASTAVGLAASLPTRMDKLALTAHFYPPLPGSSNIHSC